MNHRAHKKMHISFVNVHNKPFAPDVSDWGHIAYLIYKENIWTSPEHVKSPVRIRKGQKKED